MPRPRAMTKVAPARPKTAPEAPSVSAFGSSDQRPERAGEQRGEVEGEEARRSQRRLQQPPEEEEQEHVEADVDEAGVEEAAGDQAIPLAFGDRGPEEAEVDDELARPVRRKPARAAGDLDQEDDHVDRDQDVGRREGARTPGRAGRVPHHLGPLARALGAAHPDRGRGHAVGADRPAAGGAGDAGLAVGVAVTVSRPSGKAAYNRRRWRPPAPPASTPPSAGALLLVLGIVGFFYDASFGAARQLRGGARRARRSTAGSTSSTSPPARSGCWSPASPRAPTRCRRASSTRCWRSSAGDRWA